MFRYVCALLAALAITTPLAAQEEDAIGEVADRPAALDARDSLTYTVLPSPEGFAESLARFDPEGRLQAGGAASGFSQLSHDVWIYFLGTREDVAMLPAPILEALGDQQQSQAYRYITLTLRDGTQRFVMLAFRLLSPDTPDRVFACRTAQLLATVTAPGGRDMAPEALQDSLDPETCAEGE